MLSADIPEKVDMYISKLAFSPLFTYL